MFEFNRVLKTFQKQIWSAIKNIHNMWETYYTKQIHITHIKLAHSNHPQRNHTLLSRQQNHHIINYYRRLCALKTCRLTHLLVTNRSSAPITTPKPPHVSQFPLLHLPNHLKFHLLDGGYCQRFCSKCLNSICDVWVCVILIWLTWLSRAAKQCNRNWLVDCGLVDGRKWFWV